MSREEGGLRLLTVESSGGQEMCFPNLDRRTREKISALLDEFAPDVVHSHNPLMLGIVALAWARARGVPFVTTPHFVPDRLLEFPSGSRGLVLVFRAIRPLVDSYLRRFFENVDGIIALNRAVAEGFSRFPRSARTFQIPNGRDLGRLARCSVASMAGPLRTLACVGYLAGRKNQMFLLRVMELLPANFRLLLVGKSLIPGYERELREYAARRGLAGVQFTGPLDHEGVLARLEQAHLLVSASVLEAQSLVVIEALASGTPVVGLANETVDEFVDESVGRRLPRDASPAEFARCVQELCALPQHDYEQMAARGRARVARTDWEPVVDATLGAYGETSSAPRPLAGAARFYASLTSGVCTLFFRILGPAAKRAVP
jgi:glycosyltransferase involved in cell wall biosynthesis